MTLQDSSATVFYLLGIAAIPFSVFLYFRRPQEKSEQDGIKLSDRITAIEKSVTDIRETHIRSIEADVKALTQAVNDLSRTVIKLSTIIDERIPRIKE